MNIEKINWIEQDSNQFYVVKKGRIVGLFGTWEEARTQVDNFYDNKHNKVYGKHAALNELIKALELREELEGLNLQEQEALQFCILHFDPNNNDKQIPPACF